MSRLQLIACRVFERELGALVGAARCEVTIRYLDIGLHEKPAGQMHEALQAAIDETPADRFDAVGVAYGLCNRGLLGVQARALPVAIPRAHDCIGLLLGGNAGYQAQLAAHPGSYFQSPGWVEHLPASRSVLAQSIPVGNGTTMTEAELVARYGAENARYLLEQYAGATAADRRLVYIATPVPGAEHWEHEAAAMAQRHGWGFDRLPGDLGWLRRLLDGDWREEDFLVLAPGQRVGPSYDGRLIAAEGP
jgi:hypothetical protein